MAWGCMLLAQDLCHRSPRYPSPAPPRFRPMSEADLANVQALERECHPDPWTEAMLRTSLRHGHFCRVVDTGGEVRGHAILQVAAGEAELLNLCIGAGWRQRGLGRAFLRHMVDLAREAGAANLFLEVRVSNEAAIALYAGEGFSQVGRRPRYYVVPGGREDALVMARHLAEESTPLSFPG